MIFMGKLYKWRQSFIKSIQLQIFISLISLPFLISWGIPISLFSIFTTIIFTPFLTAFLLVSSFIFFCELLHLPNQLFIWILERITTVWISILSFNEQWWLLGFHKPPLIFLMGIVIASLALLHTKKITTLHSRTTYLFAFFIVICSILHFFPYHHTMIEKIPFEKKELILIHNNNELICIDDGVLSARPSYESFIIYTFIPELIKKTGSMTIDHFIIKKFNQRTCDALAYLASKITIKNVYIPWWEGKIPRFAWLSYIKLKKKISLLGGKIISLSKKRSLCITDSAFLFVEPDATKSILYYNASYSQLVVRGIINNQPIDI